MFNPSGWRINMCVPEYKSLQIRSRMKKHEDTKTQRKPGINNPLLPGFSLCLCAFVSSCFLEALLRKESL